MDRVVVPKRFLLARVDERPAGTAFFAANDAISMVHTGQKQLYDLGLAKMNPALFELRTIDGNLEVEEIWDLVTKGLLILV